MKFFTLLALLLTALPSFGYNLDCSTSNGDLRFSQYSKSGGAGPFPGMLLSTTQWFYKNKLVYEKNTYQACDENCTPGEQGPASNITWNFQTESRRDLENVSNGWSHHSVFATLIALKSDDGQDMTGIPFPSLIGWFICTEADELYPVP